jgi:hypothetical protein
MSSENPGALFSRGFAQAGNAMRSLDRGRPGREAVMDPTVINCHYEQVWSSRRDMANPNWTDAYWETGSLSQIYKGVTRIDLFQCRIPIANEIADRKSVYIYITERDTGKELINFKFAQPYNSSRSKDEGRDPFNLDGAFAHMWISSQPVIYQEVGSFPEYTYTFAEPLASLSRLRIIIRVENPTDPDHPSEILPVEEGEDVRLVFRIMSCN